MNPTIISPKMQRQRKMLLLLPLLVIPFLTLFFWAFSGGKGIAAKAASSKGGFNTRLPDARPKDETKLDKMSYYNLAEKDSVRLKQQMKSDPYYKSQPSGDHPGHIRDEAGSPSPEPVAQAPLSNSEMMVRRKLAELQSVIDKHQPAGSLKSKEIRASVPADPAPAAQPDPELSQMNVLLEKILDIQHPDRVKQQPPLQIDEIKPFRGIPAVVDGTQRITQGTVIRIKLSDSVSIGGRLFEKGQLIYGSGTLSNQRYLLSIKSIHIGNALYPVDLTVYDQTDGLEGISVPQAVTGEAIRDGASSGVQGMEIMSLDPSMSAQLAGAGINAAKGLFSKKVREVKGKIKNGHPLLLRINGQPK
jgi:hypothetical protein